MQNKKESGLYTTRSSRWNDGVLEPNHKRPQLTGKRQESPSKEKTHRADLVPNELPRNEPVLPEVLQQQQAQLPQSFLCAQPHDGSATKRRCREEKTRKRGSFKLVLTRDRVNVDESGRHGRSGVGRPSHVVQPLFAAVS